MLTSMTRERGKTLPLLALLSGPRGTTLPLLLSWTNSTAILMRNYLTTAPRQNDFLWIGKNTTRKCIQNIYIYEYFVFKCYILGVNTLFGNMRKSQSPSKKNMKKNQKIW